MQHAEGIFSCRTQTRYNAAGAALVSVQKQLISQLSATLAEKVITINERGLTSVDWAVYNNGTKRTRSKSVPTSDITAETVTADGLAVIACRSGYHALRHITCVAADVYDTWEREGKQEEIRKKRCSELREKKQEFAKHDTKGSTCKGLKAS